MEAFASVNDLERRWRVMDAAERARAEVLLEDAAVIILDALGKARIKVDVADEIQAANLVRVSCEMVLRVMEPDVEQEAWGAGSVTPKPAALYLSKQERKSLGNGGARIGTLSAFGG